MPAALTLMDGVTWNGAPVVGERSQVLLAALASARGSLSDERLVEEIWGDEAPANPTKALHVVVSRTRSATSMEAIARTPGGYRLGLDAVDVDVLVIESRLDAAERAFTSGDFAAVLELLAGTDQPIGDRAAPGALGRVRVATAGRLERIRALRGQALSRTGEHAAALGQLEPAAQGAPHDEELLACLLRSEAAVRGTGRALTRYEDFRSELRDRLGTDPGEALQRVYTGLLAADRPVREGVMYDSTELLGRDADVRRLRQLVQTGRVTSIVGVGGLGKTRLAHVLGRAADQPVVHFVELVGVTAPEDVIGEVGSAVGVRDSVAGRRALTPQQRSDVRARLAQQLDSAPTLLILDNCEHVVGAVADLVAFLVAGTRDLRVLTTTRAPLNIAAERVYQLGQLGPDDACALFRQRAVAARPGVALESDAVADIVTRLDGLPLAIELAAAKVRVMSVEDIGRRLENRFALLRGRDRSAPDRHQTLIAVIDWSWNLLDERERHALRWLSVFHDGFTLDAAEALLGAEALAAVESLADQSLIGVRDSGTSVRCRMLETVREFGRMQLVDSGQDEAARSAQRAWATAYAHSHGEQLFGANQFVAMDAFSAEESNLADVLRQALSEPDPESVVQLLSGLGGFWSIRGDHGRVIVLTDAIVEAISEWTPPPELYGVARAAGAVTMSNTMITSTDELTAPVRDLLTRLREGGPGEPHIDAMVTVLLSYDPSDAVTFQARIEELSVDPDRHVAAFALQWCSYLLENAGDPVGAVDVAEQALALSDPTDGPWSAAILHTLIAQLSMQLGRREAAVIHTRAAIPVLQRLGARDDLAQLRALLAMSAVADGRFEDAAAEIERINRIEEKDVLFGGVAAVEISRAELALARQDLTAGLAGYVRVVERMRAVRIPGMSLTGLEPWVLLGEATALSAFAQYGGPDDEGEGIALFNACRERMGGMLASDNPHLDYPVAGVGLFALGIWSLLHAALPAPDAVRLLVLAERFAYNRMVPSTAWERVEPHAERLVPGRIAALQEEYGDRRGPELLAEARATVEKLLGPVNP